MDNYVHINPGSEMCLNGHPVTHKRMDGKPWNCAEPTCKYSLQEDDSTPEALPNNNGQGVSEAPLPSVVANTETLAQLPAEVRPYVEKWIKQGRSEEQIHGVINFFTGAGVEAIQAARIIGWGDYHLKLGKGSPAYEAERDAAIKSAKAESLAFGLSRLIDVERGRDITEAKEAIYTELSKLREK